MSELKNVTKIVRSILEEDKQARNSDSVLYLKVLETIAEKKGLNLYAFSVPYFLDNMKFYGFPPFESVRRTRQKIQQHYPELSADGRVAEMRLVKEEEYRDYARGFLNGH